MQFNSCTLHKTWSSFSQRNYWLQSRTRHDLSKMGSFAFCGSPWMLLTVFLLTLLCHHFSFLIKKTKLIFLFSHKFLSHSTSLFVYSINSRETHCIYEFKELTLKQFPCLPAFKPTHSFFHGDQFSLFCCTNLLAYHLYIVYTAFKLSLNELNSRSYYSFYTSYLIPMQTTELKAILTVTVWSIYIVNLHLIPGLSSLYPTDVAYNFFLVSCRL